MVRGIGITIWSNELPGNAGNRATLITMVRGIGITIWSNELPGNAGNRASVLVGSFIGDVWRTMREDTSRSRSTEGGCCRCGLPQKIKTCYGAGMRDRERGKVRSIDLDKSENDNEQILQAGCGKRRKLIERIPDRATPPHPPASLV
jgi:hypothetical protein